MWSVEHSNCSTEHRIRYHSGSIRACGYHKLRCAIELYPLNFPVEVVRLAQHGTGGDVEDLLCAIATAGDNESSIGGPCDAIDGLSDLAQVTNALTAHDAPDRNVASGRPNYDA